MDQVQLAMFSNIHFLRPLWLFGLIPLAILVLVFMRNARKNSSGWERVVDPVLQPYVIEQADKSTSTYRWWLLAGWLLSLLILSGPVWEQKPLPVFQGQQAQVVLLDLSSSMLTDDLKPNRMTRTRFKLTDLLAQAEGLQIGLIAFAERPYIISPLSDDANTIGSFVESLDPTIMPVQGSRMDLAIDQGVALLEQASIGQGHVVLFTDSDVSARDITAANTLVSAGHRLSVVGIGTAKGAPLRGQDGRLIQDARGAIIVPQLNAQALAALARAGGGQYITMSSGSADLQAIQSEQSQMLIEGSLDEQESTQQYWLEYAPYAVIVLMIFASGLFRRGLLW